MDPLNEGRLAGIHPAMAAAVRRVDAKLSPDGIHIRVTSGTRNEAEQDADFAKGRDAQGNIINPKLVVTHARYGYSAHNFGMAVDVVPGLHIDGPWHPDWNPAHPDFLKMVAAFEAEGCIAGIRWAEPKTDPDHFQLGGQPVTPTDDMREALKEGLTAVWNKFAPV
jgi:hypothetical protein